MKQKNVPVFWMWICRGMHTRCLALRKRVCIHRQIQLQNTNKITAMNVYVQHIIAHRTVKQAAFPKTIKKHSTKHPSGKEPINCICSVPTLFCHRVIYLI